MGFLVDTNVLSEAVRPRPDSRVIQWLDRNDASLFVSTLTLAEILKGIHLLLPGVRRRKLESWFEEFIKSFDGRIVGFDEKSARTWGDFYARQQKKGRSMSSFDSLLAATAIAYELKFATRNTANFPPEVQVVNPWK
jgi:predicted nucleic acid-binding protein